jgi:capsular polysaccharide export protein
MHFLFLQGEPTSFYKRVGDGLSALGCKVTRINFCAGDWLFWRGPNALNYRGTLADWPDFFAAFVEANNVTDVFLCGEQRSYHKAAIEIAQGRGIRVVVTDLGYLRPDWITLERDGMNGSSRFPKDPERIMALAKELPAIDMAARYKSDVLKIEVLYLLFELANFFLFFLFPHYRRTDNRKYLLLNYLFGFKKLLLSKLNSSRATKRLRALKESGDPYFVFPLQLEHDYSIISYSPFSGLEEPIRRVIKSFALNASATTRLVFKTHPLDTGVKDWERLIVQWASGEGISDRIDFFDGGNLDEMIRGAQGMITVNSTTGIRALQLGCPVMILGDAIYDIDGMTDQGALDLYWKRPQKPDPELVDAFIKLMAHTVLVRGVFFNEPGMSAAVDETVRRLYEDNVGVPLKTSLA